MKQEPSYTVGGNVNWCSHYEEQYRSSLKKLNTELLSNPAIPLLGIHPEKLTALIQTGTCTPVFTVALHTIAKTQKQPQGPSTDEGIKKTWVVWGCVCVCVCVHPNFSHVQLFVMLWTVAHQAPLSMGFSRQEYWSGLPCPPPGDLPNPGIKSESLKFPALTGRLFITSATWVYIHTYIYMYIYTDTFM